MEQETSQEPKVIDATISSSKGKIVVGIIVLLVLILGVVIYFQGDVDLGIGEKATETEQDGEVVDENQAVVDKFLSDLSDGKKTYISSETKISEEENFIIWDDDIKSTNVGEIKYESDEVFLSRVDFILSKDGSDEDAFTYPLTLVFVFEKVGDDWIASGVEYDLKRYNMVE